MEQISYRTDDVFVDPVTGRYRENSTALRIDRTSPGYLVHSIQRLEVISDRPLNDREAICQALVEYGYCLPVEQLQALEDYCFVGQG